LIVAEVQLRDGDDRPLSSRPRFAKNEARRGRIERSRASLVLG
jgi:hypothetical protein